MRVEPRIEPERKLDGDGRRGKVSIGGAKIGAIAEVLTGGMSYQEKISTGFR
jgi:hypothetical protein